VGKSVSLKGIIILLAGIALLVGGIMLPSQTENNITKANEKVSAEGISVNGVITSLDKSMKKSMKDENNPDASMHLYEIIKAQYVVSGVKHEARAFRVLGNSPWETGQSVKIVYAESDPSASFVDEPGVEGINRYPFLPLLLMLSGGGMAFIGMLMVWLIPQKS
jgi:hypothetical protein